jgi:hypothetical protein
MTLAVLSGSACDGFAESKDKSPAPASKPPPTFTPYRVEWSPAENPLADASRLLHRPAGIHGFVEARDGHFYLPNGQRFKMWGVNSRPVPKDEAHDIAKRLSQLAGH